LPSEDALLRYEKWQETFRVKVTAASYRRALVDAFAAEVDSYLTAGGYRPLVEAVLAAETHLEVGPDQEELFQDRRWNLECRLEADRAATLADATPEWLAATTIEDCLRRRGVAAGYVAQHLIGPRRAVAALLRANGLSELAVTALVDRVVSAGTEPGSVRSALGALHQTETVPSWLVEHILTYVRANQFVPFHLQRAVKVITREQGAHGPFTAAQREVILCLLEGRMDAAEAITAARLLT
jgi:hypothetical protein